MRLRYTNDHVIVDVGLEGSFVIGFPVGLGKRSEVRTRALRLKDPCGLKRGEIDSEQFSILPGKVERGAGDGGRGILSLVIRIRRGNEKGCVFRTPF